MRLPTQDDATLYLRLHALEDTGAQVEARVVLQGFDATSYAQLQEGYPPGAASATSSPNSSGSTRAPE